MPLNEYLDWQAYLAGGTVLERLIDTHLAQITTILASVFKPNHGRRPKVKDFLLLDQASKVSTTEHPMRGKMMALALAHGAEIIDKRGRNN